MERKPDIQYVGQFYIHGSEARELARQEAKRARTSLPHTRLQNVQKIYLDPVALVGIAVAVIMLAVMAFGAARIHSAWGEYEAMDAYVSELKRDNTALEHKYRSGFDLEDIRTKAVAMGMIPITQAPTIPVTVTMPEEEKEPTWWEELLWFLDGLIE